MLWAQLSPLLGQGATSKAIEGSEILLSPALATLKRTACEIVV